MIGRNILYVIVGALVVLTAVSGYYLYQERQKTTVIDVNIGTGGISIQKK